VRKNRGEIRPYPKALRFRKSTPRGITIQDGIWLKVRKQIEERWLIQMTKARKKGGFLSGNVDNCRNDLLKHGMNVKAALASGNEPQGGFFAVRNAAAIRL
jgi:hypothetical protein